MNTKQLLGALVAMIVKICIAAAVIIVVFRLAVWAYDFGFQIFADIPVAEGEGRTVSVVITENKSNKEIAELLESKGLIRDAGLFYIQEKLSDSNGEIKPGVYELSTAMNVEEMLAIMCTGEEETTEDAEEAK